MNKSFDIINYNPDVLTCLSNLSNDEVFTPPQLVNKILDELPKNIWLNKNIKFLDPVSKTGVFLREIAKRLMEGLKNEIPDEQERANHIFKNQIYGVAITELTSLLSRRSLYCSKNANGKYSVCEVFDNEQGNIKYSRLKHKWDDDRCIYCGASKEIYNRSNLLETYAYEFIHTEKPEAIFNMKFDVIVGNPPYQLSTGGAQAQAIPLYNKFVEQAKKLNPRYLTMIIPSRWFTGGFGLDSFRKDMLNDKRIRIIHDFLNASDCFPGVEIKGGVCYFLWDRDNKGKCEIITHSENKIISTMNRDLLEENIDVFIRYNEAVNILKKIKNLNEDTFDKKVSSQRPFGFSTNFKDILKGGDKDSIKIYANKIVGYLPKTYIIEKNKDGIDKWKLFTPKAIGSGNSKSDWVKPILGEPNSICTETYVMIGPYNTKQEAENVMTYIQTKFFHFLLTLRKNTQDALAKVYSLIPLQDFSQTWDDKKLYKKYNLTEFEIEFIESMVRPEIGEANG